MPGSPLSFSCQHRFESGFDLDATFEVSSPVTALFGPSGSGKTTILSMIAGVVRPEAGTIRLGEQTLLDSRAGICLPPERRQVGVVFQEQLLFPHLSVADNLRYGQRRRQAVSQAIAFERVIEVLELGELVRRFPRNLSGGERQRVALGRALLCSPRLLLMDEPLSAVDVELKDRILTYLERVYAEWHVPTLYVSHVAAEVRRLAEWVVVLERGRVRSCSPTAEVKLPE